MSNSQGSTSFSTGGNGQRIQLNAPNSAYGWNRPNTGSSNWYRIYQLFSPDPNLRGGAQNAVMRGEWDWNGYGYGN